MHLYADFLHAQTYTSEDSIRIYKLLDQADEADMAGNLDRSMQIAKDALSLSKERKMLRGEGFALLKIADLRLKKEGVKELLPCLQNRNGLQSRSMILFCWD